MRGCQVVASVAVVVATAAHAPADVVTAWNGVLLDTIRAERLAPPQASRVMAIVSTAVYDAVNAADPRHAAYRPTQPAPGASAEAAAAQAAHDALAILFPAWEADYAARLAADLDAIPAGPARSAGVAVGAAVARAAVDARATDGAAAAGAWYDVGLAAPGRWRPTPPGHAAPLVPGWSAVKPFGIPSASVFLPPPPPALGSPEYVAEVAEVKMLGSWSGSPRTADQTQIAFFWADGAGTATPPGHWNQIAAAVADSRGLGLAETARLLAMLDVALADAAIAAWDAKYHYDVWRPVTAIRQAEEVAATAAFGDDTWTPLLPTPPFPEYVSGHSTFSAAAATVLAACFGTDDIPFVAVSDAFGPGVTRSFSSFSAAAAEAGMSRIYGGIHFASGNVAGADLGQAIGGYVATRLFAPVPEPGSATLAATAILVLAACCLGRRGALAARRRRPDTADT
jgi:membrane-associated phospholipid phosphatase